MNHHRLIGGLLLVAVIGMGAAAPNNAANSTRKMHHHKMGVHMDPALVAQATVTPDSAQAIALRQIPGGSIRSGEILRESGKLTYSFGIKVEGKTGLDRVQVDAMSGSIVSVKHESPRIDKQKMAPKQETGSQGTTSGH